MVTRAIIEEKIDNYLYRVRIPIYHKVKGSADATPTENLPIASVCLIPGIYPTYKINNVVYVAFLEDHIITPVILGLIFNEYDNQASSDVKCESLIVNINELLSPNIKIGNVEKNDIQNLSNTSNNILLQLNYLMEINGGSSESNIYYDGSKEAMIVEDSNI